MRFTIYRLDIPCEYAQAWIDAKSVDEITILLSRKKVDEYVEID